MDLRILLILVRSLPALHRVWPLPLCLQASMSKNVTGAESGSMWAAQPTSQTSETQAAVVPEVRVVPKHTRQVPGNPLLGTNKKFLLVKAAREKRQNTLLAKAAREREDARQASMPYWFNARLVEPHLDTLIVCGCADCNVFRRISLLRSFGVHFG